MFKIKLIIFFRVFIKAFSMSRMRNSVGEKFVESFSVQYWVLNKENERNTFWKLHKICFQNTVHLNVFYAFRYVEEKVGKFQFLKAQKANEVVEVWRELEREAHMHHHHTSSQSAIIVAPYRCYIAFRSPSLPTSSTLDKFASLCT